LRGRTDRWCFGMFETKCDQVKREKGMRHKPRRGEREVSS
jgi:hypothetical protein